MTGTIRWNKEGYGQIILSIRLLKTITTVTPHAVVTRSSRTTLLATGLMQWMERPVRKVKQVITLRKTTHNSD